MNNFIFFGSPLFAKAVLELLVNGGFIPAAVVVNPDRPVGRKKVITAPAVKTWILQEKLPIEILQPEYPKELEEKFNSIKPDFFIVASYAKIIPKNILDIPRLGTIGVHPSLLPKYRGASPIQSAILHGETETGMTLYVMDEKMDNGPILAQSKVPMHDEDYASLSSMLAEEAGKLLLQTLPKFIEGTIIPIPQDTANVTSTKKFSTDDGFVEIEDIRKAVRGENPKGARAIHRKVLALGAEPGVWTLKDTIRIKIIETEICGDSLVLKTIQEEGRKQKEVSDSLIL